MILGVKENDRVVIALGGWIDFVCPMDERDVFDPENVPLRVYKDTGVIAAGARSDNVADLLFYDLPEWRAFVTDGDFDRDRLVSEVVSAFREKLRKREGADGDLTMDNAFIVAKENVLTSITPRFYVRECDEIFHGYVPEFIKGRLAHNRHLPTTEERIADAIAFHEKATGERSAILVTDTKSLRVRKLTYEGAPYPFTLTDTETGERRVFTGKGGGN